MNVHTVQRRRTTTIVSMISLGTVIALSSFSLVRAEHASPDKKSKNLFQCSTGQYCLSAQSTGASTFALYATSKSGSANAAVVGAGQLTYGVVGLSDSSYGLLGNGPLAGVFGEANGAASSSAPGVYGYSISSGPGTEGANIGGSGVGVYGASQYNYGVEGASISGDGIYAVGLAGLVADTFSGTGIAVLARNNSSTGYPFYALNTANETDCAIDQDANMICSGDVIGGAVKTRHRNGNGQRVLTYASESASATVEDVGEARMFNGVANVMIASDFASVIDRSSGYYVFLTPLGDTRGLYVSMKTPAGFQVREDERGRTSVAFDYRIVARPIDANGDRLPPAPRLRRPHAATPTRPQLPAPPKMPH
jgi:hypothetical protein